MGETVFSMVMRVGACLVGVLLGLSLTLVATPERSAPGATNPIQHVVVIYMENQSFDGVLGQLCIRDQRPNCAAASQGKISNGTTIQLQRAPDLVPPVAHGTDSQLRPSMVARWMALIRMRAAGAPMTMPVTCSTIRIKSRTQRGWRASLPFPITLSN
jgi:Phosphoesterase family